MLKKFNIKFILTTLLFTSLLCGDDIQRLETIVKDIRELRVDYEECKSELQSKYIKKQVVGSDGGSADISTCQLEVEKTSNYAKLLEAMRQENRSLRLKISTYSTTNSALRKTIEKFDKELKNQNNVLISKDKKIISLENKLKEYRVKPALISKTCEEKNIFPKLMMREDSLQEESFKVDPFRVESSPLNLDNNKIVTFKPSAFRVKFTTAIYDSPNGKKIEVWEKNRSFTSTQKVKNWIKITGYFIDKKWQKAKRDIWVKEEDVFKR